MSKNKRLTDDEIVLSALGAAKLEGAKALLIEISPNTISSIRIFLDDEYRHLLSEEKMIAYEVDPKTGRAKRYGAPN